MKVCLCCLCLCKHYNKRIKVLLFTLKSDYGEDAMKKYYYAIPNRQKKKFVFNVIWLRDGEKRGSSGLLGCLRDWRQKKNAAGGKGRGRREDEKRLYCCVYVYLEDFVVIWIYQVSLALCFLCVEGKKIEAKHTKRRILMEPLNGKMKKINSTKKRFVVCSSFKIFSRDFLFSLCEHFFCNKCDKLYFLSVTMCTEKKGNLNKQNSFLLPPLVHSMRARPSFSYVNRWKISFNICSSFLFFFYFFRLEDEPNGLCVKLIELMKNY